MQSQFQSIVELAQNVEAQQKAKADYISDTRSLSLRSETGNLVVEGEGEFEVSENAHRQIAARLQIPYKYYDRCRREKPELLSRNVNTWFESNPERRMVRTLDGRVRAFLSDRYQRIDNFQILQNVLPVLQELEGLQVRSLALTETNMYVKATVPLVHGEIKVGDIVEAGFGLKNSEVGLGALSVIPLVFRRVCDNGLNVNIAKYSAKHIGSRADTTEDVYQLLSDEALKADDNAILLKTRDVLKASVTQESFDRLLLQIREASDEKIEGRPIKAVETLSNKFDLGEREKDNVLQHLIEGHDLSRWGVINAVTRTAQDAETYDRSDELESLGGKILSLPSSEWREIAAAA